MELAQLVVFARPPTAGQAKTRLAGLFGERGAAKLYEAFAEDTIALCERVREAGRIDLALWSAGAPDPTLSGWGKRLEASVREQPAGDLGVKLSAAFDEGLARYERVLVIGTDLPSLPLSLIVGAFDALERASLVLGPSNDGGYYAVGATNRVRPSFDRVHWSSPRALRDTVSANAGKEIAILPPWYDIDEPDDLQILRAHLSLDSSAAPASARCLAELSSVQR